MAQTSAGINTISVQWGAWSIGMAANDAVRKAASKTGMMFLRPRDAMDTLEAALGLVGASGAGNVISIMNVDWDTVLRRIDDVPYMLRGLRGRPSGPPGAGAGRPAAGDGDVNDVTDVTDAHAGAATFDQICARISAVCASIAGTEIGLDDPLMEHGIDSLGTVELQNAINRAFKTTIDATTIFNFPSVRALSEHVASVVIHRAGGPRVGARSRPAPAPAPIGSPLDAMPLQSKSVERLSVAISGIVQKPVVVPSDSPGTNASRASRWQDCVVPTPASRWDVDRFADEIGANLVRFGVHLEDIFGFDNALYRISAAEALSMDPQHRAMLETAFQLRHRMAARTCVMTGIGTSDYLYHINHADPDGYFSSGCAGSVSSGRLSYLFNLSGSSVAVDTACSSSSVALHLAFGEVRSGSCERGLVSGVNAILSPRKTQLFTLSGMLGAEGRCKTLDASANGYVRSESCCTILLAQERAITPEHIVGYVEGTVVNQDGRSAGLTAPNGPAQERAIAGALADAGVAPGMFTISLHGTGTELGDPIEIGSVSKVFRGAHVSLVSTKSALGHAETGAGLVGVAGLVECQAEQALPPMLHVRHLNRHIASQMSHSSSSTATTVAPRTWGPAGTGRVGGTSAFAFQGTNAHVITVSGDPLCIDTEAVIWAKKAHCVVPIRDCGLALDAVTPRVVHLSYRPSRTLLPPIPQIACMLVLHHVSDLVFKDAAGIVKGVAMEITGPVVDRGTKAQAGEAADDAIVTAVNVALTKDGTVDILFDGSAIFACKIGSIAGVGLGADAAEPGHPRWAPRLDGRPERATECVSDRVHGPSNGHDASEELLGALEASCALWAALTDVTTHSGRPGCLSRLDVAGCIRVDTDLAVNRHLVLCRNASGDPAAPAEVVCGAVRSRLAHTPPSANAANFYDVRSTRLQLPVADQVDRRVLFLHQNERAAVDPARLLDAAPASCAWTHVRWNKAGEGSGPNRALQGDIFISSMTQLLVICESSAMTECLSVVGTGVGIVGDGGPAFAAAGSDRRTSSPFGSPYGSSPVEFFAAFALADMNIKLGAVSPGERATRPSARMSSLYRAAMPTPPNGPNAPEVIRIPLAMHDSAIRCWKREAAV